MRTRELCDSGAPGIVRDLRGDEIAQLRRHLMRLDPASLRDRFNGIVGEEYIAAYASRCFAHGTVIAGYLERGVLRAAAELHPSGRDVRGRPVAEIAFSVEKDWQRRGIGTRLFRRLIRDARGRGIERLHVTTHADNDAMRALARIFGAVLQFRAGETVGIVDIGPVPDDLLFDGPINRDAGFAA
jgi:GNAT superfamily N-acetyltransferase